MAKISGGRGWMRREVQSAADDPVRVRGTHAPIAGAGNVDALRVGPRILEHLARPAVPELAPRVICFLDLRAGASHKQA